MKYNLEKYPINKIRQKKEINWTYKKTNTPEQDLEKFIAIKSKEGKHRYQ